MSDASFPVTFPSAATADTSIGSTCAVSTSAAAEVPGSVQGENQIWQLGQVQAFDGVFAPCSRGQAPKAGQESAGSFV